MDLEETRRHSREKRWVMMACLFLVWGDVSTAHVKSASSEWVRDDSIG